MDPVAVVPWALSSTTSYPLSSNNLVSFCPFVILRLDGDNCTKWDWPVSETVANCVLHTGDRE